MYEKFVTIVGVTIAGISISWWYYRRKIDSEIVKKEKTEIVEHPIGELVVDFYEIKRELGRGTSAIVYEIQNKRTGLEYALKCIRKQDWRTDKRIQSEISILKEIHEEHIVNLYETFETAQEMYLVLDLVNGVELFEKVVELKTYSEDDARELTFTVLKTLDYLHTLGIVHRDLKPENLLLPANGTLSAVKLTDFGMAARCKKGELMYQMCGSQGYVAPEIFGGDGYNSQVDLYSLGCICYILLSGYPPYVPVCFPGPEWNRVSSNAIDFVEGLLQMDPNNRMNAKQALQHRWIIAKEMQHDLSPTQKSLKQLNKK